MYNVNLKIINSMFFFQYVVVPTRRGTAEALQILFSHLFGDAGSPYLIGMVSDSLKQNSVTEEKFCQDVHKEGFEILNGSNSTAILCDDIRDFYSMQYSLVVNILVVFLGAVCFFITAIYIIKDKEQVERFVAGTFNSFLTFC